MALEASNVLVGVTGGVYVAPLATVLPADATTALAVTYLEVGYLDESGVVESQGESNTKIKAWQNADVVRVIQTEHTLTMQFTCIETNPNSLELFYGNYTVGGVAPASSSVEIVGGVMPHQVFVFEVMDGTDHVRIVVEDGQVTERGDVAYVNGAAVGYSITVECFVGTTGAKAIKYLETAGTPSP